MYRLEDKHLIDDVSVGIWLILLPIKENASHVPGTPE